MKLYDYVRSTAAYRVRIALRLKGIHYDAIEVHLLNNGGEHHHATYQQINPQELLPSLEVNDQVLTQSLAIIDYLDETYPEPPLLPKAPLLKAKIRSLALIIACDIHPLNNLRTLNRLKEQFNANETQVLEWYHHWLKSGFDAIETQLQQLKRSKAFCSGTSVSLADICLIPQVFNAKRVHFPMDAYPIITDINAHCLSIPAFAESAPSMTRP